MHDPIDQVNKIITNAKKLAITKYTGLMICGDFNLPGINWTSDGAQIASKADTLSSKFVNNLEDNFLTQFVQEPKFGNLDNMYVRKSLCSIKKQTEKKIQITNSHIFITVINSQHKKVHNVNKVKKKNYSFLAMTSYILNSVEEFETKIEVSQLQSTFLITLRT